MLGLMDLTNDNIALRHEDSAAVQTIGECVGSRIVFLPLSYSYLVDTCDHSIYVIPSLFFREVERGIWKS